MATKTTTKEYKYRVRYVEGEQHKPPSEKIVCPHLTPEAGERVWKDEPGEKSSIALMLANDPGWSSNYQVRHCQVCKDVEQLEDKRLKQANPKKERPLHGDEVAYTLDGMRYAWKAGVEYGQKHHDDKNRVMDEDFTKAFEEALDVVENSY